MDVSPLPFYRLEFAKRAEWRREKDERRSFHGREFKNQKDREDREKHADEQAEMVDILIAAAVAFASDSAIGDFRVTVDIYDAATIEALHVNEVNLTKVRDELRLILEQAYVLPDGRRVFKTEDGLRVFDEHGVEMHDFDPEEIEDWRPRWEPYSDGMELERRLTQEREELHRYQDVLDETRAELDEPGLTEDRLAELRQRLEDEKPDAVKRVLGEDSVPSRTAEAAPGFDPDSLKPDLIGGPVGP